MINISFLKLISLCIIICFCNKTKGNISNYTGDSKNTLENHLPIDNNQSSISSDFKNPIREVVRKVFQDNNCNICFGTQNGIFKLTETTLIHIDGIKSE